MPYVERPKLDSKSRVVIPAEKRDRHGLEPGDVPVVMLNDDNGHSALVESEMDEKGRIKVVPKKRGKMDVEPGEGDRVTVYVVSP